MNTQRVHGARALAGILPPLALAGIAPGGPARLLPFDSAGAAATSTTAGGSVTLQNDSGAGQVVCPCFIAGEEVAVWLTSPCEGRITSVQIGWGSVFGGQPDSLEQEIRLYRAGDFPEPGAEITAGELLAPLMVDGFINDFDIAALDFGICAGETIVVSLEFLNDSLPPFGPGPVHDGDGCQLGKNTVMAIPGGWADACLLGVTGDWVIRAVVECGGSPCTADGDCTHEVDIVDLLGLLAAWGGADPTWDIAPAGAPDGIIDIQDLLELLAQWGPC